MFKIAYITERLGADRDGYDEVKYDYPTYVTGETYDDAVKSLIGALDHDGHLDPILKGTILNDNGYTDIEIISIDEITCIHDDLDPLDHALFTDLIEQKKVKMANEKLLLKAEREESLKQKELNELNRLKEKYEK